MTNHRTPRREMPVSIYRGGIAMIVKPIPIEDTKDFILKSIMHKGCQVSVLHMECL